MRREPLNKRINECPSIRAPIAPRRRVIFLQFRLKRKLRQVGHNEIESPGLRNPVISVSALDIPPTTYLLHTFFLLIYLLYTLGSLLEINTL